MFYLIAFAITAYILFSKVLEEDDEAGKDELHIYFYREDRDYKGWNLWIWEKETEGAGQALEPSRVDVERALFIVSTSKFAETSSVGFLMRKGNWEQKDGEDRFWNPSDPRRLYTVEGKKEIFLSPPDIKIRPKSAFLDSQELIQVFLPCKAELEDPPTKSVKLIDNHGLGVPLEKIECFQDGKQLNLHLKVPILTSQKKLNLFRVIIDGFEAVHIKPRGFLYLPAFNYDVEMGMSLEKKDRVVFRVFAPTADRVEIILFHTPEGPPDHCMGMVEINPGLWEIKLPYKDWKHGYYKFRVHGDDLEGYPIRECLDPYSRCHTHRYGRSHIQFESSKVIEGPSIVRDEIIIYESHLRDFSIAPNSGIKNKGKYLSLTEKDSNLKGSPDIKTGIAHLKELGVNVLHLLPLQNFDSDDDESTYDWGYMPCHYFAPHGSYASNPSNLSRVKELKKLVNALHEEGIKLVLDVVFNHTAEGQDNLISFQALAPHYYYRHTHEGDYFNGSGCGNEFKTEAPMARKLILDCLKYWVNEYKIDGFRFDLLGLLDYETFKLIESELVKIKPDIILYGEPWAAAGAGTEVLGKGVQRNTKFGVFNDHFRDALRGDNSKSGMGFVQGDVSQLIKIKHGIIGSINDFTQDPVESINYAACHDNYTLRDKLVMTTQNSEGFKEENLHKMETIIAVLLLTSQGIPFIHSGQEFGRSKNFNHNSYNAPDSINMLDWSLKVKNKIQFSLYRDLITLRKQHRIFRLQTGTEVESAIRFLDPSSGDDHALNCIIYQINNPGVRDSFGSALVAVNASARKISFNLPEGDWMTILENGAVHLKISSLKPHSHPVMELGPWDSRIVASINHSP